MIRNTRRDCPLTHIRCENISLSTVQDLALEVRRQWTDSILVILQRDIPVRRECPRLRTKRIRNEKIPNSQKKMKEVMQIIKELTTYQPDNLTDFQLILFWILVLAIIALWCFIDIIGYLLISYLVKYTEVEKKYPNFKWLINLQNCDRYKNLNFPPLGTLLRSA